MYPPVVRVVDTGLGHGYSVRIDNDAYDMLV
jgi:hypothetical protein